MIRIKVCHLWFRIILSFLAEKNQVEEIEISPIVKELSGIISVDKNFDFKKEYGSYIQEKYS
ncbi:MAG: DUF6364 family protein [candidate division KSB1 bacterium]|nr:DUF6364 family protein [candidate division KSB1 bacterium]